MRFFSLLCMLCLTVVLSGAEPIFYAPMDGSVTARIARGEKKPAAAGKLVFQKGLRGQAMVIGKDEKGVFHGVEFDHKKNLNWEQGAISFWVKPLNWKGRDTGFFVPFFSTFAGENYFIIYKYLVGEKLYFMRGKPGFWLYSQYQPGDWKTGDWHHIVCMWDKVQLVMYIDGELVTERRIYFPLQDLKKKINFTIGESKKVLGASKKRARLTLLDEFYIFDRMLSAKEIRALYLKDKPRVLPDNLITVPYKPNSFVSTGFTDPETDELAYVQNRYTLSCDDRKLYVALADYPAGSKVELSTLDGKKKLYPFNGRKLAIDRPDQAEKWIINIFSGKSDLRGGAVLAFCKKMPSVKVFSLYDHNQNAFNVKIDRAPGVEMIFDRDTSFNYGFSRIRTQLVRPYSYSTKSIDDWYLNLLSFNMNGRDFYRSRFTFRKKQPTVVKFMYTKIKEKRLLVAFQGRAAGSAVADFFDTKGKLHFSEKVDMPQDAMTFFDLEFPVRAVPGNYIVRISHLAPSGKKMQLWEQELRIPPERDPKIAPYVDPEKDKLPQGGWIPVEAGKTSVRIWGRTIDLTKGLFFSSIVSQGKELLAEPDALVADGKRLAAKNVHVKKISSNVLEAVYSKTVDYGVCKVESRLAIGFDGYVRIKMNLIPNGRFKVKELAVELPMKNERLKLFRDNNNLSKITGIARESFCVSLRRIASLWVGDYYTGINFTAENLVNWHYRQLKRHAEMKRDDKAARVRFLLVSAPLVIRKAREYNFGFTVTPTKPLDRKFLRKREKKDLQIFSPWYHFCYFDPFRIKMESPWNGMQYFNSQRRMFPILLLYNAYNFTGPFSPEWTYYEENWRQIKFGRTYGIWTGNKPYAYCEGCINSADYRNFKLNQLRDFFAIKNNPMLKDGTRNLYYDAPWEESCYNEKHGCKLWRDSLGKKNTHVIIDLFREKAINIWRILKRQGKDSRLMYHAEWQRMMPYQTFSDALCGGEGQELEVASNNGYFDILTPAAFNVTFSPYLWHAKMTLIPQLVRGLQLSAPAKYRTFSYGDPKWRRACLHYFGLAVVHDVDLMERSELSKLLWKAQDELGWDEKTEFHPYYADKPAVKVTPVSERIVASAYTHSGRLMLAVLNDTDKVQDVTVKLDLKKLGVKAGLEGSDVFTPGRSWKLASVWKQKIQPREFVLVLFK